MSADQHIEMSTDEALISALSPKAIGELELKPFSLLRQVIAVDLSGTAQSHFFNAVMTIWVCTLEPREALAAHQDIALSQLKAFEWAEAQGYSMTNYDALFEAYSRLNRELAASSNARKKGGDFDGDRPKNAGGPAEP
jgi:hypothetical protein